MLECITDVLGSQGTLVLPVFTYSFGSDKAVKIFNVQESLSKTSSLGNELIATEYAYRSHDPMLSVVAVGHDAKSLTDDVGPICFGPCSIWERLYEADALIMNLNLDSGSTFLHWVEREAQVPYRSDITMTGTISNYGVFSDSSIIYTGRDLSNPASEPKFEAYHSLCIENSISKTVNLGRGQIVTQKARVAKKFLDSQLPSFPLMLTSGFLN